MQAPLHTPAHSHLLPETPVVETTAIPTGWSQKASNDDEWDQSTIVVDTELENGPGSTSPWAVESHLPRNVPLFTRLILNTKAAITYSLSRVMSLSVYDFPQISSLNRDQSVIYWLEACLPIWISHHLHLWIWLHEKMFWHQPDDQKRYLIYMQF